MAIFRAGKRVGPFDIRVGFPRDKSLDRVDQDPRLRQQSKYRKHYWSFSFYDG